MHCMIGLAHYQKSSIMMPFKSLQTNGQSVLRSRGTLLRNNICNVQNRNTKYVGEKVQKCFEDPLKLTKHLLQWKFCSSWQQNVGDTYSKLAHSVAIDTICLGKELLRQKQSSHLLCCKWLFTRWPAASADISDSSPASTVPHTMRANLFAFSPGHSLFAPVIMYLWTYEGNHF